MPKKSLQAISDYYSNKGLFGKKLQKALERDQEYQRILLTRRQKLKKRFALKKGEAEKYVLSTDEDYQILWLIHQLERKKLSPLERRLVEFARTQLEREWRKPLIKFLKDLLAERDRRTSK